MKAMWSAFAATILIAVIAGFVLSGMDDTSTSTFSSPGVRPPEHARYAGAISTRPESVGWIYLLRNQRVRARPFDQTDPY